MSKKFVRGITDIKTINNQDLDTNNVNDLLSDGKHNYIHRKKSDGSEEYHNLTNNLKTIQSDDTDLVSVTNYNNTTNSATIRPKHDAQKEQVLESTDNTILIEHGENGTEETTSVDVNPAKVLEHDNLLTDYGITKTTTGGQTTLGIGYTQVAWGYDLNNLRNGRVRCAGFQNAPKNSTWFYVTGYTEGEFSIQEAIELIDPKSTVYKRTRQNGVWGEWRVQVSNKDEVQDKLQSSNSIIVNEDGTLGVKVTTSGYTVPEGTLDTYVKMVEYTNGETKYEFTFNMCIAKGKESLSIPLTNTDKPYFHAIMQKYGTTILGSLEAYINRVLITYTDDSQGCKLKMFRIGENTEVPLLVSFTDLVYIANASLQNTSTVEKAGKVTVEKVDEVENVDKEQETE